MPRVNREPLAVIEARYRFEQAMEEVESEDAYLRNEALAFYRTMQRSAKGNLWRRMDDGACVTIFRDREGLGFKLCIVRENDPIYPGGVYASEEDAVIELLKWLLEEVEGGML